jgi:hypothetical protein
LAPGGRRGADEANFDASALRQRLSDADARGAGGGFIVERGLNVGHTLERGAERDMRHLLALAGDKVEGDPALHLFDATGERFAAAGAKQRGAGRRYAAARGPKDRQPRR